MVADAQCSAVQCVAAAGLVGGPDTFTCIVSVTGSLPRYLALEGHGSFGISQHGTGMALQRGGEVMHGGDFPSSAVTRITPHETGLCHVAVVPCIACLVCFSSGLGHQRASRMLVRF